MSWRSQATVTGTNDTALVNQRRFGPTLDEASGSDYAGMKRGREDEKSSTPDPSGKLSKLTVVFQCLAGGFAFRAQVRAPVQNLLTHHPNTNASY